VVYVWIRDTRVGEITIQTADFYRIFFQSHVFPLVALFAVLLLLAYGPAVRRSRAAQALVAFAAVAFAGLVLGLSRSFWFGGFVGALALFAGLAWARVGRRAWLRIAGNGAAALLLGVGLILAVYSVPFPSKSGDVAFASLLGRRALSLAGEAAANSRWALLPELWRAGLERPLLGSGLGTTVTYTTSDPRLLAQNPTGEYTTFAFEWGYHDLWVKFGILGIVVYAWFIAALLVPYVRTVRDGREALRTGDAGRPDTKHALIALGVVAGVAALLGTHVFSPYLNHPLGIGILLMVGAYAAASSKDEPASAG